jgi:hypothetical protein
MLDIGDHKGKIPVSRCVCVNDGDAVSVFVASGYFRLAHGVGSLGC